MLIKRSLATITMVIRDLLEDVLRQAMQSAATRLVIEQRLRKPQFCSQVPGDRLSACRPAPRLTRMSALTERQTRTQPQVTSAALGAVVCW